MGAKCEKPQTENSDNSSTLHQPTSKSERKVFFRGFNSKTKPKMSSKFRVLQNDEKSALSKKLPEIVFLKAIDPELKCVRCDSLPVRHFISGCRHLFCSNCFNDLRNQKCPRCDENLDRIKLRKYDLATEKRIYNLKVYCSNKKDGCQEAIPLFNILEHERICPHPLPTAVIKENHTNGEISEPVKESSQRLHEGLNLIIKDKSANKLREEFQIRCEAMAKFAQENLLSESKNLESLIQSEIEKLEFKIREEVITTEQENIQKESLKLKEDFSKNLNIVEDNTYLQLEKITERLNQQEKEIKELRGENEILSTILRIKTSQKASEDAFILICGPAKHRVDFLNALANYMIYESSKQAEEAGIIQLNPLYSTSKMADSNNTAFYHIPIEHSRTMSVISWEPSFPALIEPVDVLSNYHDYPALINDFELLESPVFAFLENQFKSLNALYFILDREVVRGQNPDFAYLSLLHYVDKPGLLKGVKFIVVDNEEAPLSNREITDFLVKFNHLINANLESGLNEENLFWISLQPYHSHLNAALETDETRWQNSALESRRLLMSLNNEEQTEGGENNANSNLLDSILATKEALKGIHDLTDYYHQAIVRIVYDNELANSIRHEIETLKPSEGLAIAWFKKSERTKSREDLKDDLGKKLEMLQSEAKVIKQLLEKEKENMAVLIARFIKYYDDNLLFQRHFLDKWLWRYWVEKPGRVIGESEENKGWFSFIRGKGEQDVSVESKTMAHELWFGLKKTVEEAQLGLKLNEDDGSVEEGYRIGNQVHTLLKKILNFENDVGLIILT